MNRIFTLFVLFLCFNTFVFAQDEDLTTLQFVDANGNVVESGSTLKFTVPEEDAFGGVVFDTGLNVKNTTTSKVSCNIAFTISQMDGGEVEVCFPSSCQMAQKAGSYETQIGDWKASYTGPTMSKWLPEDGKYGKCVMKMQLQIQKKNAVTGKYSLKAYGPVVTVEFEYSDASGLSSVLEEKKHEQAYNILGQPVGDDYKGLVLVGGRKVIRK